MKILSFIKHRLTVIRFFPVLFLAMSPPLTPAAAGTVDAVPVCCWRLLDQEKYISDPNPEALPWREIRKQRKLRRTANQDPKRLTLEVMAADGAFHSFGETIAETASVFLRDPDGVVHTLKEITGGGDIVTLPPDENLTGRYLLGAHAVAEKLDMDGDGVFEPVHFCAKQLIPHRKSGGNVGSVSVVFFDDPARMPLEIGPVINTAKSRSGGGSQTSHRSYEMMVKFKGAPLAGAQVDIIAEGAGWRKSAVTDESGIFEIIPTDDRALAADWQRYIYVTFHRDSASGRTYISTMPTEVHKNRPEWRSKTVGFVFWAIIGCGLCLLGIWGHARRKRWQETRQMAVFKNHRIEI